MKIIFLDIDGVLCTAKSVGLLKTNIDGRLAKQFDPDCVVRLNHITDATGAQIVISSSWRLYLFAPTSLRC